MILQNLMSNIAELGGPFKVVPQSLESVPVHFKSTEECMLTNNSRFSQSR